MYNKALEEIDVKAKPADLPSEIELDASKLVSADDKLTIADIVLPAGVEFANREIDKEQVVISVYDPAAEAAAREAEEAAAAEEAPVDAADVPADNGQTPEEEAPAEEA